MGASKAAAGRKAAAPQPPFSSQLRLQLHDYIHIWCNASWKVVQSCSREAWLCACVQADENTV